MILSKTPEEYCKKIWREKAILGLKEQIKPLVSFLLLGGESNKRCTRCFGCCYMLSSFENLKK